MGNAIKLTKGNITRVLNRAGFAQRKKRADGGFEVWTAKRSEPPFGTYTDRFYVRLWEWYKPNYPASGRYHTLNRVSPVKLKSALMDHFQVCEEADGKTLSVFSREG